MPCSIRMPIEARHQERERHRDEQRIVEQRRIVLPDQFLHDEGDVGAEHHHFAVRHVDDAHHAERDGKADRGEQQHRAERDAVPGVLHRLPDHELAVHARRCASRAAALTVSGHRRRQAGQRGDRVLPAARPDRRDGAEPVGFAGVVGMQQHGGARFGERPLDALVGFLGERGVQRRQRRGFARLEHRLRGGEAASPGSAASSVRPPIAASMARRSRLLMPDGFEIAAGSLATGWPVAASNSLSARVLVINRLGFGACNSSRPACSASMIAAARGSPVAATSEMPSAVSLKSSAVKRASASLRSAAWAAAPDRS